MKKNSKPIVRPTVYCSNCLWFSRDTDGPSRNNDTGEYFLGICQRGLHPDSDIKQFANKPRHCQTYRTH